MTPAALEVLCDAAREGGATEEEVARVRLVLGERRKWRGRCLETREDWVSMAQDILAVEAARLSRPENATGASAPSLAPETP